MTVEELRAKDERNAFKIIKYPRSFLLRRESDGYEWRITKWFAIDLIRDQRWNFDVYNEDGMNENWEDIVDLYEKGAMISSFRVRESGWMRYYEYTPPTDEELIEKYSGKKKSSTQDLPESVKEYFEERRRKEEIMKSMSFKVRKTRKRKFIEFELTYDGNIDDLEDDIPYKFIVSDRSIYSFSKRNGEEIRWWFSYYYKDELPRIEKAREILKDCLDKKLNANLFCKRVLNEFELDTHYVRARQIN